MKLSPRTAAELGTTPWAPMEFGLTTPKITEEGIQSMVDLFRAENGSPTGPAGPTGQSDRSRVLKAEAGLVASAPWLPGEALGLVSDRKSSEWVPVSAWEEVETPTSTINAARKQAERMLAEARAQADDILQETRKQADTIILNAHQEGWMAAEIETQQMLETARSFVEQVTAWRDEMLGNSQEEVLDLVRAMAKRMFGEGIALPNETLQEAFNLALQEARALGDIRLYVHPQDAASLDPYWRDFQVAIGGHQIKIIPSEAIRRGGCFIDGEMGSVDARVETQLKSIMDVLGPEKDDEEGSA